MQREPDISGTQLFLGDFGGKLLSEPADLFEALSKEMHAVREDQCGVIIFKAPFIKSPEVAAALFVKEQPWYCSVLECLNQRVEHHFWCPNHLQSRE